MDQGYEQILGQLTKTDKDIVEARKGNASAGTRVRKAMMEIKKIAQRIRAEMLTARK